jgi:hypothetical protein
LGLWPGLHGPWLLTWACGPRLSLIPVASAKKKKKIGAVGAMFVVPYVFPSGKTIKIFSDGF